MVTQAAIAQLGERQTEDLKVPGSIPGLGNERGLPSATTNTFFDDARRSVFFVVGNNSLSTVHIEGSSILLML